MKRQSAPAPDEPLQPTPQGSEGLVERLRARAAALSRPVNYAHYIGDEDGASEAEYRKTLEIKEAAIFAEAADRIEALEGERDSVSVSQSASALLGAPSGSEPSAAWCFICAGADDDPDADYCRVCGRVFSPMPSGASR